MNRPTNGMADSLPMEPMEHIDLLKRRVNRLYTLITIQGFSLLVLAGAILFGVLR